MPYYLVWSSHAMTTMEAAMVAARQSLRFCRSNYEDGLVMGIVEGNPIMLRLDGSIDPDDINNYDVLTRQAREEAT